MRTGVVFPLRALFGLTLAMGWLSVLAPGDDGPQRWVTTWTTANAAGETGPATVHGSAFQTNYVSGAGNFAAEEGTNAFATAARSKTIGSWYFLSAVEVLVPASVKGAVVALGDSITDGASSRLDKNERWTDVLGRRLLDNHIQIAVLNAGIGGNRVL